MQAYRDALPGNGTAWPGRLGVGLACLVGAVGIGRGAGVSGFLGLAPALLLAALGASTAAARGRVPNDPSPTLRLPPAWAVGVCAAAGFLTTATPRVGLGLLVLLGVTLGLAPRLRGYWPAGLTGLLSALLTLAASVGLPATRLLEACLLQGLIALAMAAAVLRATDRAGSALEAGPWLPLAAAMGVGALGAGVGAAWGGFLAALVVGAFTTAVATGPGAGALVGVVAGLICLPALRAGAFAPGAAALAGAAAGLGRPRGPLVAVLAYGVATLIMTAIGAPGAGLWALGATLGAALGGLLLRRWLADPRVEGLRPGASSPAGLRPSLPERLRAAATTCLELSRDLAGAPLDAMPPGGGEPGLRLAEEVCPGCPALTACWERKLPRARRMVSGLWGRAQDGPVAAQDVGGQDTIFCLRPREMAEAANRLAALARQRAEFLRLVEASRRTAIRPLVGIGRVLADLAEEVAAAGEALPLPGASGRGPIEDCWQAPPVEGRLGFEASGASLARQGAAVSGDSFRCRLLGGDRLALVLSDGMGSGGPAAVVSAAAVEQVLARLAAGSSADAALRITNAHLLGDSSAERFATLQVAIVHLRQGLLEWHCMGAPPGLLRHARGVREWGGGGLPAGILGDPEIRSGRARLRAGDLLVMLSDGVGDPGPRGGGPGGRLTPSRWVIEWVRAEREPLPAGARRLLAVAHDRAVGDHDDLTVLFCRLIGGGEGGGAETLPGAVTPVGAAGAARIPPVATR